MWTREDMRYVKDAPSISPVSYPTRVAPLSEDRVTVETEAEKATHVSCRSLTIILTWWCQPLPPRRGGEGVEARQGERGGRL